MKISLFSQSLFSLPLMEAIEATAQIGFPAIELACANAHFSAKIASENPDGVAEHIQANGLEVSALSLFSKFTDRESLEREIKQAEKYIRLAPLFHTNMVKITPGPPGSADATEEHWHCLGIALEKLIPIAEESNVKLAFETHMRQLTDTLAGSKQLLDIAKSDVVGLTVDFSNFSFAGENMSECIDSLQGRIYNTHLKNGTIGDDGSWNFNALDEGLTDYSEVFPLLSHIGYNGYFTIECLGADASNRPIETATRDLNILRRYLKKS